MTNQEKRELKLDNLPNGFLESLNRRHNGRNLNQEYILKLKERIDLFFSQWEKAQKRLNNLWRFWDDKNVEQHFQEPIWYNAHSRRKLYEKQIKDAHEKLFYTLLLADGNNENFNVHTCISPIEIKDDFYRKYIDKEIKNDRKRS